MSELTFGVLAAQGWNMELASIEDRRTKWDRLVDLCVLAEDLGFDSLWFQDHLHNLDAPGDETMFECWTAIAAVSQRTSRIKLGQLVGCAAFRNPAHLAKISAVVDVISGGRLIWGIGAGWYEREFVAYGYPFRTAKERVGVLRETVEIVTRMWSEPEVSYEGRYFTLHGAQCDPKPLQKPRPEVLVGGIGERRTLRIVAELADASNFRGLPDDYARSCEALKRHCADIGRDYDQIRKTWAPQMFIREDEKEIDAHGPPSFVDLPYESWKERSLVGTPEQVAEKISSYIQIGCTGFYPWCVDYPEAETMRLFAEKVIPEFRPLASTR